MRNREVTTIPVHLVACTTRAWVGLVGEEAAAHSRLVPTETLGAAMRALLQMNQATAILLGTSKAPAAADVQIGRRFPLFPILLLPDDPGCDQLCHSDHASRLGACPPRVTGGQLPGIMREATERARLSSPAGLLLTRLLMLRPELSLLARRFLIACLTSEPAVRRPNAVAAQLRVSLRTLERECVEERLAPPGRVLHAALLWRAACLLQAEDHTRRSVAAALGLPDASALSAGFREILGLSGRSVRGPAGLDTAREAVLERITDRG